MIKVLVVDDSALVRKLLTRAFAHEADVETRFARNGVEALGQLCDYQPDVVTLDIHMPEMDGLACLDRIMVERPCPVVMISALTEEGAETTLEALRLGAVDFISKPGGALSLQMDEWGPEVVATVRAAAAARLKPSLRLRERVSRRIGARTEASRAPARPVPQLDAHPNSGTKTPRGRATGDGLVLVGSSTGGPPALEALLTALPAAFPWPILVAQHMPANFTGALARRLDALCAIAVREVAQPTPLEPGVAYIGRGDGDLIVSRRPSGLIALAAPARAAYLWRPSANRLVGSAMEHLPESQLIGVLMTGMGADGAEAMAALHAGGGRTIAEAEETAVVWGMPGALVKAGGAGWIEPLPQIAERLLSLVP